MPGAIFLACVRAWACGVCQSDALTLLYTLVCVSLRACKEQNLPQAPLVENEGFDFCESHSSNYGRAALSESFSYHTSPLW